MENSSGSSGSVRMQEANSVVSGKGAYNKALVAYCPKKVARNALRNVVSISQTKIRNGAVGDVTLFLFKVVALETVRRISKAKCPFAWRGLQAMQFLCYPPFKWIQRWAPLKGLVQCMQMLSKPLLVLSIATSLSDQKESSIGNSGGTGDTPSLSELLSNPPSMDATLDTRTLDEAPQSLVPESWLVQLYKELDNQGINLPERFDEDELHRFYRAANGDLASLLSSIKKTLRWRETYKILSHSELDMWSDMVFWHGFDVRNRPCLIVRLGLACISLPSHDKPRFAQAVISQVEHGVVHLVNADNPQITVLVDCEGLSPLRIPMQMMRSCSALLQAHFPNRLGCLYIIRLPAVVRVLAQTLIQVLKPVTRKKLKIEGEMYEKILSEYLQILPAYLGGKCTCSKCLKLNKRDVQKPRLGENNRIEEITDGSHVEDLVFPHDIQDIDVHLNGCDQVLRTAIISILMIWVFMAVIIGLYDPENRLSFSSIMKG